MTDFFDDRYMLYELIKGELDGAEYVGIKEIINDLCESKYTNFLHEAIIRGKDITLETIDFCQFSSLDNATVNVSKYLSLAGNEGYNWVKIATFLLKDEEHEDNYEALRKYGENHLKTAEALGLIKRNKKNECWLTKIGYVFSNLDPNRQKKLLSRLVLRLRFIQKMLSEAVYRNVDLYDEMAILKESTRVRRSSNAKTLMNIVSNNDEVNLDYILSCITYKGGKL